MASVTVMDTRCYLKGLTSELRRKRRPVPVTTTDKSYIGLSADAVLRGRPKVTVIDFWRCLKHLAGDPRIHYVPVGLCRDASAATARLHPLWG